MKGGTQKEGNPHLWRLNARYSQKGTLAIRLAELARDK